MTTAIVILNWNGRDFLKKYLPGVVAAAEGTPGARVVVADNASTDGSLELLAEEFPAVGTVQMRRNHGFAEGYNRALAKVEADCYLLLNSDVEVDEDFLLPLVEWMQLHPECGICGPKLHDISGSGMFEYAGAAGGYLDRMCYPICRGRVMKLLEKDEGQYDIPADVMWVSGAALMIRSSLFHSLGGFCKDFFAHMEEIDLCWRARLEGWRVCMVPRSAVRHVGGGSLQQGSPRKLFFNYRNNLLMMARNLPATWALDYAFSMLSYAAGDEEAPDRATLCNDLYADYDDVMRDDIAEVCIHSGVNKAKGLIFRRMCLDGLSAAVYLVTGRFKYVKAVVDAHREFRAMRRYPSERSIRKYLVPVLEGSRPEVLKVMLHYGKDDCCNAGSGDFRIRGIWSRWSVPQALFNKRNIFGEIRENIE